jgi:hypothetical protein
MNKRTGLLLLLLGVAVIVIVFIDPTGMGKTRDAGLEVAHGPLGDWPLLRIALMAAGACLAVLGAYGVAKKAPEKK